MLIIATRLFWPTNNGKKVSLHQLCEALNTLGYEVHVYSFFEEGQSEADAVNPPKSVRMVRTATLISKSSKMKNVITKYLLKGWPMQCCLYFDKNNVTRIKKLAGELQPQLVIVDMIRLAPYSEALSHQDCLKVLFIDDLLSDRYERQLHSSFAMGNIAGQYSKSFSSVVSGLIETKWLRNIILKSEAKRMRKAESSFHRDYDKIVFCSQKETSLWNLRNMTDKAVVIPQTVDTVYFSEKTDVVMRKGTLAFVGNLGYPPNVASLHLIADQVLPMIKHDVNLLVIGRCPDNVRDMFKGYTRLTFCGQVDDLRVYVKQAGVFLAPIAYGTGINNKILEAMAMGVPVVTNSTGAEGLPIQNGRDILISDQYNEMASFVDTLLEDAGFHDRISSSATALVRKYLSHEVKIESIKNLVEKKARQ